MGDRNRLTTDRWFGELDSRLDNLIVTLEYVETHTPTESDLIVWILNTTGAQSRPAVKRRLRFLESVELLNRTTQDQYTLTERSEEFLQTEDTRTVFEGLRQNVLGFDNVLSELAEGPLSNNDIRNTLATNSNFEGGEGVASRHREWLQMLGLLREREDSKYELTDLGRETVHQHRNIDTTNRFVLGEHYRRSELHDEYGGNRQARIAPCADNSIVFVFTGSGGETHGYDGEFLPDGSFVFIGECQEGDMEFVRGNATLRDHRENGDELHFFRQEGDGFVTYLGQFQYADHGWNLLSDTNENERNVIQFRLDPIGPIMIPNGGGYTRFEPDGGVKYGRQTIDATDASCVFMARGYKDNPFHRHVSRSLANYFSEETREELREVIRQSDGDHDELLELLTSETVTAWGAKSEKTKDSGLFDQMSIGDIFIMRTGQPTIVRFVQQVDLKLGTDTSQDLRQQLSEIIWTGPDYDLLWLSATPVIELRLPEDDFVDIVRDAKAGFEMSDWFPSQGQNFTRINQEILDQFGGVEGFIEKLREWETKIRQPGTANYFLLDATKSETDVRDEQFFEFEKKSTELANAILEAENDGKVLLHDGEDVFARARIGNIEGSRVDGSIHKSVFLLDYDEFNSVPIGEITQEDNNGQSQETGTATLDDFGSVPDTRAIAQLSSEQYEHLIAAEKSSSEPMCISANTPAAPYYFVHHPTKHEFEQGYLRAPADDKETHDLGKLKSGDIVFNYTHGLLFGYSEVTSEPSQVTIAGEVHCEVDISFSPFSGGLLKLPEIFPELLDKVQSTSDLSPIDRNGVKSGYLYNLSADAGELLFELGEHQRHEQRQRIEERLSLPTLQVELPPSLYFHAGEEPRLKRQINAALNSGKHIIFTGPPGTGKSKLAKYIASEVESTSEVDGSTFATATAEWTTFDTIGGYIPAKEEQVLEFDPRLFLRCFRREDGIIQNQWLILDELNRANIDKAIGPLFSVLAGDSVDLPFEDEEQIRIDWVDEGTSDDEINAIAESKDRYPVTPAWRMIGTMNTFDKTSLYDLSYAFMRRFSFIHVGVPELTEANGTADRTLLDPSEGPNYATVWLRQFDDLENAIEDYHEQVTVLWEIINRHRTIGPSIVLDMFRHVAAYEGGERTGSLTSAVTSLVFPQLEGMRERDQKALLKDLETGGEITTPDRSDSRRVDLQIDTDYLWRKAEDIYELNRDES